MKKVVMLMLVTVMIAVLAACGKKDPETPATTPEPTKEAQVTKEAEKPTEEATKPTEEVTEAPTAEPTEEPTAEPTAEPTEEPVDEPITEEFDEFDGPGHDYDGIWVNEKCLLDIEAEGAAEVIFAYLEKTDRENFGSWHEYWTNFSTEDNTFTSNEEIFHYFDGAEKNTDIIDRKNHFVVSGDKLVWTEEDLEFTKITEEISVQDAIYKYLPNLFGGEGTGEPDTGTGFGADKIRESGITAADLGDITFFGICIEEKETGNLRYYEYQNGEVSFENMDEFDCAFIFLGSNGDIGQLCFLEQGINSDIKWDVEDGRLKISCYGDTCYGDFYNAVSEEKLYVCIEIGNYNVWMAA